MPKRSVTLRVSLVLLTSVVVAGCGNGSSTVDSREQIDAACEEDPYGCVRYEPTQPIDIGALLWLSEESRTAGTGVDSQRGVELALDYLDGGFDGVNGEVLGHDVALGLADEGCDPKQGIRGARMLASREDLLAVVGTTCSSAAIDAAAKVLSERGIVLISPTNTAPELTDRRSHPPFYARTAPNDLIQGAVVGDFAVNRAPGGKALVLSDGSAYSESLAESFSMRFEDGGGEVERVTLDPTDTTSEVSSALSSTSGSPDILYLPLNGDLCTEVVAAAGSVQAGLLLTSDGCFNSEVLAAAETASLQLDASGPDVRDLDSNRFYGQELLPAYRESFGESPTAIFHAHAFDAANLIFDALRRSALEGEDGYLAVPRSEFRTALFATEGYDGFSGTLECNDLGDCQVTSLISIYATPDWPVEGGRQDAAPIYSQSLTLLEVLP
ncbi:MAG: branched-chain amino acid ABC transporter substrate-binding protein [bacterium]